MMLFYKVDRLCLGTVYFVSVAGLNTSIGEGVCYSWPLRGEVLFLSFFMMNEYE